MENLELSPEQLNLYQEIVLLSQTSPDNQPMEEICLEREDRLECISLLALAKKDISICFSLHHWFHEQEEYQSHNEDYSHDHEHDHNCSYLMNKCLGIFLKKSAGQEIDKCRDLSGYDYFNCLSSIFQVFGSQADCQEIEDEEAGILCQEVSEYYKIYAEYNRELCVNLTDEKLRDFCLNSIVYLDAEDAEKDDVEPKQESLGPEKR